MPPKYDISPYLESFKNMIDVKISDMTTWFDDNKIYDRQPKSPYMIDFCVGVDIEEKKFKEVIDKIVKSFRVIVSVDSRFKECIGSVKYDENEEVVRIYINAGEAEEFNVKIGFVSERLGRNGSIVEFKVDGGGWGFECFRDAETFYALSFTINYFYDNIRIYAEK